MLEQGIDASSVSILDRLAHMGDRAMGALTFKPARGMEAKGATPIVLKDLVNQARQVVHGVFDNDAHAHAALHNIIEVGTSAGGARAKAVIAWNPVTQEIRSGQVATDDGFEHWLLKFDGMGADRELGDSTVYGRIEYAYYLMAKAAGISMMESHLLQENGRAHFMTKRFDRAPGNVRHHVQTLCAMSHLDDRMRGANSYAQYFTTMEELGLPYSQKEEAFRRMVFNVLSKNCDDHSKNFSFRLRQGNAWELAPAYDLAFAHNPKGEWTNQHLMSVNGKFKDFKKTDLLEVADRYAIGTAKSVITQIETAIGDWHIYSATAAMPKKEADRIAALHVKF